MRICGWWCVSWCWLAYLLTRNVQCSAQGLPVCVRLAVCGSAGKPTTSSRRLVRAYKLHTKPRRQKRRREGDIIQRLSQSHPTRTNQPTECSQQTKCSQPAHQPQPTISPVHLFVQPTNQPTRHDPINAGVHPRASINERISHTHTH
jgi:hypothetical protein